METRKLRNRATRTLGDPHYHPFQKRSIKDLPTEILSEIVFLSTQDCYRNLSRVQKLGKVCSHWRDMIENTPRLWSRVTAEDPLGAIEKALIRSKDTSLEIQYDYHKPNKPRSRVPFITLGEYLQAVNPHVGRWRTVDIVCKDAAETMFHGLQLTAAISPRLESFSLTEYSPYVGRPITLFQGANLPSLHQLTGFIAPLRLDNTRLANLRRLTLHPLRHHEPSPSNVQSLLRGTPMLEELVYAWRGFDQGLANGTISTSSGRPVVLNSLRKAWISTPSSSSALWISRCIRAPRCRDVNLFACTPANFTDPAGRAEVYDAISCFLPSMLPSENQERVRIHLDGAGVAIRTSTVYVTLEIVDPVAVCPVQTARWTLQNFIGELTDLHLSIEYSKFTIEHLETLTAHALPGKVSKFSVGWPLEDQGEAVLQYLSGAHTSPDGQTRWPFPHMTELNVDVSLRAGFLTAILILLKARAEGPSTLGIPPPRKISHVSLHGNRADASKRQKKVDSVEGFLRENGGQLTISTRSGSFLGSAPPY
ncbi:hypothetical protein FRB90_003659 [Tulasnella sp. 427]|nr:hypothetical protein FRB90_003659 [Tulasnella sp. 427]